MFGRGRVATGGDRVKYFYDTDALEDARWLWYRYEWLQRG